MRLRDLDPRVPGLPCREGLGLVILSRGVPGISEWSELQGRGHGSVCVRVVTAQGRVPRRI